MTAGRAWRRAGLAAKRVIDFVGALVLFVVFLPLGVVVALAIKLDSPGPILFVQQRVGRYGTPFRIYKFRTMIERSSEGGPVLATSDPRLTRVGRVLRRTSLDEVPQLLNVLRGDMSLVGPRPLLPGTTRTTEIRRHDMRPGMTGLVEVRQPHRLDWDRRMEIDVEYVERWSLRLDLSILIRTVPAIFLRKDILDPPRDLPNPGTDEAGR